MSENNQTIAIVDDDPVLLEILQRAMAGYFTMPILIFPSGEDYLQFFEKNKPAIVLLDAGLPGISGLELLGKIREVYSRAELPVIFISADADSAHVVKVLESGANDFTGKPLDLPVLAARMRVHLSIPATLAKPAPAPVGQLVEGQKYRLTFLYCQVAVDRTFAATRQGSDVQGALTRLFDIYSKTVERYKGQLWLRKDDAGFFVFQGDDLTAALMCALELLTTNIIHEILMDRSQVLVMNLGIDFGETVYRADPAILQSDALNHSAHLAKTEGRGKLRISKRFYEQLSQAGQRYFRESGDHMLHRSIVE
ncbi:MAG: response regulator [Spirochaetia bacterium]|nr:response regulator [Spirochaetia bacterium]